MNVKQDKSVRDSARPPNVRSRPTDATRAARPAPRRGTERAPRAGRGVAWRNKTHYKLQHLSTFLYANVKDTVVVLHSVGNLF